jgi:hypothetical protein
MMLEIERFIHRQTSSRPQLQKLLRNVYQGVFDLLPVRTSVSTYEITERRGCFFGFHDKCPWSADGLMLLAHRTDLPLRLPRPDDIIEVGLFSGPNHQVFNRVGTTRAWNWHQGAMLQWLGSSSHIVYNDFDGTRHVARVVDAQGQMLSVAPVPVTALSPDGNTGLSYDLARLRSVPFEYGCANGEDPESGSLVPPNRGLDVVDIPTGVTRTLFSVADIARIEPSQSMRQAFHYFTHCQFSPSGGRFTFFHRWLGEQSRRWTRMISCNLDGGDLYVFPTSGMVSHVAWLDDHQVLAYARMAQSGDGYYLFHDTGEGPKMIGESVLQADGHPSVSPDRQWIITDTYPDRFRMRRLILYSLGAGKRYDLARLHSPRQYSGPPPGDLLRCDLHPRWSRDGGAICFDSAHSGTRALCTIRLGDIRLSEPRAL